MSGNRSLALWLLLLAMAHHAYAKECPIVAQASDLRKADPKKALEQSTTRYERTHDLFDLYLLADAQIAYAGENRHEAREYWSRALGNLQTLEKITLKDWRKITDAYCGSVDTPIATQTYGLITAGLSYLHGKLASLPPLAPLLPKKSPPLVKESFWHTRDGKWTTKGRGTIAGIVVGVVAGVGIGVAIWLTYPYQLELR